MTTSRTGSELCRFPFHVLEDEEESQTRKPRNTNRNVDGVDSEWRAKKGCVG